MVMVPRSREETTTGASPTPPPPPYLDPCAWTAFVIAASMFSCVVRLSLNAAAKRYAFAFWSCLWIRRQQTNGARGSWLVPVDTMATNETAQKQRSDDRTRAPTNVAVARDDEQHKSKRDDVRETAHTTTRRSTTRRTHPKHLFPPRVHCHIRALLATPLSFGTIGGGPCGTNAISPAPSTCWR